MNRSAPYYIINVEGKFLTYNFATSDFEWTDDVTRTLFFEERIKANTVAMAYNGQVETI